jgi:hypothetical protein
LSNYIYKYDKTLVGLQLHEVCVEVVECETPNEVGVEHEHAIEDAQDDIVASRTLG